jgi:hypothetical protein
MEARFLPSAAVAALGALLADAAYLALIASEGEGQLRSARSCSSLGLGVT